MDNDSKSSTRDPDSEVMLRFIGGDERAFTLLIERHRSRVINLAYRFLGVNSDEAEDVAQEVFIKVYRSAPKYTPASKFSTWIYRITVNTCLNELRRRKVRKLFTLPLLTENLLSYSTRERVQDNDEERVREIKRAVDSLPSSQRLAIILRRYDGLSHEEIGEVLKLSSQAVKSLIFRGMENLKKSVKKSRGADGAES